MLGVIVDAFLFFLFIVCCTGFAECWKIMEQVKKERKKEIKSFKRITKSFNQMHQAYKEIVKSNKELKETFETHKEKLFPVCPICGDRKGLELNSYCENCGCAVYSGACVNCHEEVFIAEQNITNEEPVPIPNLLKKIDSYKDEIKENKKKELKLKHKEKHKSSLDSPE